MSQLGKRLSKLEADIRSDDRLFDIPLLGPDDPEPEDWPDVDRSKGNVPVRSIRLVGGIAA